MQTDEYRNIFKHQDSHWWYLGMRYINESFLLRYAPKKKNISILDVGCGSGAALRYLSKIGKTIGLDASNEAIKYARRRGKVVKGDIQSLPFPSATFDIVTCMDVLYHQWVNNEDKAIAEMHRVLKKGGILLLREPAFEWLRSNEDAVGYTTRRYRVEIIKHKLQKSFHIHKLSYANFFLFPLAFIKRLPIILHLKDVQDISEIYHLPAPVSILFTSILKLEAHVLPFANFPIGTSVICVARKK